MRDAAVRNAPAAVDLEPSAEVSAQAGSWVGRAIGHKTLLFAGVPVVSVVAVVVLWSILVLPRTPPTPLESGPEAATEPGAAATSEAPKPPPKPVFARLDHRWLPDRTRLVVDLRLSTLAGREEFDRVVRAMDLGWRPSVSRVAGALGLAPSAIQHLTWASTDLSAWSDRAVVALELEEGHSAAPLASAGEAIDLRLAGSACRRLPKSEWPHPFAVVGERTIVTGREDLLKELSARGEPRLESQPIDRLLKGTPPDAELVLLVDLGAARDAGWRLPVAAMDVWPAGQRAWRTAWELPVGLGFVQRRSDRLASELALVCEGETAALKVRDALAEFIPAAKRGLAVQEGSLSKRLQAGEIKSALAGAYESLLKQGQHALQALRWEVAEDVVWLRIDSSESAPGLLLALFDNRPAMLADWLAAARVADEANHRGLLSGLGAYLKAERHFPAGAEGGAMLAPETRLSWIATLLPYYGHLDWHRELQFGYPWNAPQNRPVTQRPLERVVNPALGPSRTDSGFPVTHYVGVSGVGPDAGNLKPDDPRAGAFGYGRTIRLDEIGDGAGNTIAVLGASQRLGAWASGGDATVRALTKRPYVNGPDGFGSGQPDGMLAGMADGSVRFISKDIDPIVVEQLATINGRERVSVAAIDAKPAAQPTAQPERPPTDNSPLPRAGEGQGVRAPGTGHATAVPTPEEEATERESPVKAKSPQVDVQARLADRVAAIDFSGTPLVNVIDFLGRLSTLRISYDLEAMAQLGVRLSDPVSLRLSESRVESPESRAEEQKPSTLDPRLSTSPTVGEILKRVLASRGLVPLVVNDQVLVTCPPAARGTLREVRYTVSDLVGGGAGDAEALAGLVRRLVAPESWRQTGGPGSITSVDGTLTVNQSEFVHYQVLTFCEKLRAARGIPLRSREDRERFSLVTRLERIRPKLSQPVTVNYGEAPLEQIVADLAETGRTSIVIDWLALGAEGVSPQARGTLKVENRPLAEALGRLLRPLGLACRIAGSETLEVTGRKALAARLELEFHPANDLVPKAITGAALVERIKSDVGGATWNDAGGPAVLHFDEPSRALIVLQSQPIQMNVGALLADLRAKLLGGEARKD